MAETVLQGDGAREVKSKFVVIVHDPYDPYARDWRAPLVEASSVQRALEAAGDAYPGYQAVCALDEMDIQHMLDTIREGRPRIQASS